MGGKKLLQELEGLQREGWVVAYTDGSAKRVRGWMQEGMGSGLGWDTKQTTPRMCRPTSTRASAGGGVAWGPARYAGQRPRGSVWWWY